MMRNLADPGQHANSKVKLPGLRLARCVVFKEWLIPAQRSMEDAVFMGSNWSSCFVVQELDDWQWEIRDGSSWHIGMEHDAQGLTRSGHARLLPPMFPVRS